MSGGAYGFRPMTRDDLQMIARWLREPHVIEWWGDPEEQLELVTGDLGEPAMRQFIVTVGDEPFGYIQTFDLKFWPDPAFADHPDGTQAIDQFIGKPDMVGRGHGSAFVRRFVDRLIADGAPRVITDPDLDNGRAIRAYEKAGFVRQGVVETVEGPALLMVHER